MSWGFYVHNIDVIGNDLCREFLCDGFFSYLDALDYPSPLYLSKTEPDWVDWDVQSTGVYDIDLAGTDFNNNPPGGANGRFQFVNANLIQDCDGTFYDYTLRHESDGFSAMTFVNPAGDGTPIPSGDGTRELEYHVGGVFSNYYPFDAAQHIHPFPDQQIFRFTPIAGFQQGPSFNLQGRIARTGVYIDTDINNNRWRFRADLMINTLTGKPDALAFPSSGVRYSEWFDLPKKANSDYSGDWQTFSAITFDVRLRMDAWAENANVLACYYEEYMMRLHWYDPVAEVVNTYEWDVTEDNGDNAFWVWGNINAIENNWGFYDKTFNSFTGTSETYEDAICCSGSSRIIHVVSAPTEIDGSRMIRNFNRNFFQWDPPSYC
jgi:hypothetical protein